MKKQYVAIDLHRSRSLVVRDDHRGKELAVTKIENDPLTLAGVVAEAGEAPEVAIEATNGWYWAVDVLQELGANVHLVHTKGLNWEDRRVKNDYRDCRELLDRLHLGKLPEAWIAPTEIRELRELVRYRSKLVNMRTSGKAQVKAILIKHGLQPPVKDLWGVAGPKYLDEIGPTLAGPYVLRLQSLRGLVEHFDAEIARLERHIARALKGHRGYRAIQVIPGVGPVLGAVFVAEIGDVTRFASPKQLCSWAGLTPKHHESDTTVWRGKMTKQGSVLVRWAAIEAVSKLRGGPKLQADFHRITDRRGKNIGRSAVARRLLTLIYYGLRDGQLRCFEQAQAAG